MTTPAIEGDRVVSIEEFNTTLMLLIRTEAQTSLLYLLLKGEYPSYGVTINEPDRNILKIFYINFTKPEDCPPNSLQADFYREDDPDENPYTTLTFSVEIPDPDTTAVNIRKIVKGTLPQQTE